MGWIKRNTKDKIDLTFLKTKVKTHDGHDIKFIRDKSW
jgi:hypothetical protein